MEDKNILIIIISVCFVILVLIGAALFYYWPQSHETKSAEITIPLGSQPEDKTQDKEKTETESPSGDEKKTEDSSSDLAVKITISNGEDDSQTGRENKITIKDTSPSAKEDNINKSEKTEKTKAAPDLKPADKKTSAPAKTAPAETKKEPRLVTVNEYWIQAASFKNRENAEALNARLTELGYPGTIQTRTSGGEIYFRLRIGPYSSNEEANKFLIWIKSIDGLEGSYVSLVKTQKYVY